MHRMPQDQEKTKSKKRRAALPKTTEMYESRSDTRNASDQGGCGQQQRWAKRQHSLLQRMRDVYEQPMPVIGKQVRSTALLCPHKARQNEKWVAPGPQLVKLRTPYKIKLISPIGKEEQAGQAESKEVKDLFPDVERNPEELLSEECQWLPDQDEAFSEPPDEGWQLEEFGLFEL